MPIVAYLVLICPLVHTTRVLAMRHDHAAAVQHFNIISSSLNKTSAFFEHVNVSSGVTTESDKSNGGSIVGPIESRYQAVQHFGGARDYSNYISWARFAAVIIVGEADWREKIARVALGPAVSAHVSFGPVFSHDYSFDADMLPYLQSTIGAGLEKDLIFFTATDPATVGNPTHFISYVLDRRTPTLYVFNPAVGPRGIQDPAYKSAIEEELTKFYRMAQIPVQFWPTTTAPQVTESDVFCQTWSLILAIEGVKQLVLKTADPIPIPSRIEERNQMLLTFWQSLLAIPGFPDMLEHNYVAARHSYGHSKFDVKDMHEAYHLLRFALVRDTF